jgi:hypothetical protein
MNARLRVELRVWAVVLVLVALHEVLARGLDRADLIARLLAPAGAGVVLSLLAALVLYGLRIALVFFVPGWLVARAVFAVVEHRRVTRVPEVKS